MTLAEVTKKIEAHQAIITRLETQKENLRKQLTHPCCCAKGEHCLGEFTLICTHWYKEPYSCTGGDYWVPGEWRLQCPDGRVELRLFFNNHDLDYKNRDNPRISAEAMFKNRYLKAFKKFVERHDDKGWWDAQNNISYYIDENREKFELISREEADRLDKKDRRYL